ncbi:YjgB family protein [Brevibacillus sp. 179-C9.3 HS]|uniref:YjgB family protein n=1 Tax=unclassified Brevibacillus TaxID=2684853 RepID=UPI0039A2A8A1
MRSNSDQDLLGKLQGLPDMKMSAEKKQEIVSAIRQTKVSKSGGTASFRGFSAFGKGLAICSVLAATVWLGIGLITNQQQSTLPDSVPPIAPGSPTASPGPGPNNSVTTQPVQQTEELLSQIRSDAEKGRVIWLPFVLETTIQQLEKGWSKPEKTYDANGLTYAAFPSRGVVFGYNKGMQLVDMHRTDPKLQRVSLSAVEKSWGEPSRISEFGNQTIYTYDMTSNYQVKLIFQGTKSTSKDDLILVEYHLYYPQGNKNLMLYADNAEILQSVRDLAQNGQTFESQYRVEKDVFDDVEKQLGKPDVVSVINGITYNTYRDRNLVYAFNKGMQLVDIRSYDPRLQAITLAEVQKTLGNPASVATTGGQTIYTYKVTPNYELKIIFSGIMTKESSTLYIDHVNIYYPRGTFNNMAG